MAGPVLDEGETAVRQIERLGFSASDVEHVFVTHLDVDHCGGLPDFPHATVHLLGAELRAATPEAPSSRYRPAHWGELDSKPEPHPVLDIVQTRSEVDHGKRVTTQDRLRTLDRDHSAEVTLFSAHDPWEFGRLAS